MAYVKFLKSNYQSIILIKMKQFKYTINGNIYNVTVNNVEDTFAEVEVNGTPYKVQMDKPAKKQMVTLKRPVQAPTT